MGNRCGRKAERITSARCPSSTSAEAGAGLCCGTSRFFGGSLFCLLFPTKLWRGNTFLICSTPISSLPFGISCSAIRPWRNLVTLSSASLFFPCYSFLLFILLFFYGVCCFVELNSNGNEMHNLEQLRTHSGHNLQQNRIPEKIVQLVDNDRKLPIKGS